MTTQEASGNIVLVPVPVQYLPEVYDVLAKATARSSKNLNGEGITLTTPAQGMPSETHDPWTQTMVVRLHRNLHLTGARALLDALARATPDELALTACAELAGITPHQMAGQLAGLTRRCRREFERVMGPYHVRYDEMGKAYYWMSEDVAGWWIGDIS